MTTRHKDQNTSKTITVVIHLLLLLLAFIPVFQHFNEPPAETMVIQFASQEEQEQSNAESGNRDSEVQVEESVTSKPAPPTPSSVVQNVSSKKAKKAVTQDVSDISEESAAAEEKEVVRDFGSLFSGSSTTQTRGDDRDLSELSSATNIVGKGESGLNGRSVVYAPLIEDASQKTGRVVVDVCVDSKGIVTSASYTQKGSTTNDLYLVNKAEESAKKWRFSASENERQCGVITIEFYLK